jgi:NAD(P)-dependent dehydrogenase (short-subunit alcohol dehydrogenase family)
MGQSPSPRPMWPHGSLYVGTTRATERVAADAEPVCVRAHGLEEPGIRWRVAIRPPGGVHVDAGAVGVAVRAVGRIREPRLRVRSTGEKGQGEQRGENSHHARDGTRGAAQAANRNPDRSGFWGANPGFSGPFRDAAAGARERAKPLQRMGFRAFARVSRLRRCTGSNLPPSALFSQGNLRSLDSLCTRCALSPQFSHAKLNSDECRSRVYVTQLSTRQMLAQKTGGSIVTITAALARNPIRGVTAAVPMVTKGGRETITQHLAMEYAKDGIRVNAVGPGVVDTPLQRETPKDVMESLSPMGRPSAVKDITDAVMYLTDAATVTGHVLYVDGGAHFGRW